MTAVLCRPISFLTFTPHTYSGASLGRHLRRPQRRGLHDGTNFFAWVLCVLSVLHLPVRSLELLGRAFWRTHETPPPHNSHSLCVTVHILFPSRAATSASSCSNARETYRHGLGGLSGLRTKLSSPPTHRPPLGRLALRTYTATSGRLRRRWRTTSAAVLMRRILGGPAHRQWRLLLGVRRKISMKTPRLLGSLESSLVHLL